jgi:hypothetical protein
METFHEMLHLDKLSFVQWKTMGIPTSQISIIFCFTKALNMVMVWNFVVMLGQALNNAV